MRAKKGSVSLESVKGMLRLRLPRHLFNGNQKYIILGLADNPNNRKAAKEKIEKIESDIAYNNFDFSFERYKSEKFIPQINIKELWDKFTEYKSKFLSETTIIKDYGKIRNHLKQLPDFLTTKDLKNYLNNQTPETSRRILLYIKACCNWGMEQELIKENPFKDIHIERRKKSSASKINPFNSSERIMILEAFKNSEKWNYYHPFINFLFLTGCRPSEGIALQWKHISENEIVFKEAIVLNKKRKDTKTHTIRKLPINNELRELIESLQKQTSKHTDLIFCSPKGKLIDLHNLQNRAWKKIVNQLPIEYRPMYNTRHTFISNCLEKGVNVAQVAQWVGNSPETIYKHYAGTISNYNVPNY